MGRSLLVPILILVGLLGVAAVIYVGGNSKGLNRSLDDDANAFPSNYPEELFSFDVTNSQAVFAIDEVNEDRTLLLRFIFPGEMGGSTVISQIQCPLSDSWIITLDKHWKFVSRTPASQPLEIVAKAGQTLQGICDDRSCATIGKLCELVDASAVSE